jgi:hypothetical protein
MLRVLIKRRENFVPRLYFYPFARLEILNFVVPNLDWRGLVSASCQSGDKRGRLAPKPPKRPPRTYHDSRRRRVRKRWYDARSSGLWQGPSVFDAECFALRMSPVFLNERVLRAARLGWKLSARKRKSPR